MTVPEEMLRTEGMVRQREVARPEGVPRRLTHLPEQSERLAQPRGASRGLVRRYAIQHPTHSP